ncbi:unnamed protein product [Mytilus edulis]|uniref:CCHC-type domain-containing protein n=1 Tax=Mytilus edulis TaxID=6550 RepID=A0A8S3RIR8_MYTED|nr:unnamed protein product [Mytilus edulis]
MSTININTTTKEELMGIRDIGEAIANLIMKARKITGTWTLEDLKIIEGVPNTIWDPLIRKGTVEVSPEEETPEKLSTAQYDTSAILEQYKTKLLIAEQDKVHSKREYTKELEDLKVTFEKQLWRKSAEIEECLAELQQTKDNFQREVEKDQLEREKSQKELSFENTQIKQEMSELQHQYESTMAEKEGDFSGRMESMQRERQTLMDKVMEQAQEMDKERERSKEQYKQMKQRDAEYGRKLTALEEQLQHFKTSRLISEKLAPGDIFRGKVTEMSASSWYSDSAKLKSRQTFSSDKLGDSTEEVTNNGKTSTSGKGKDDSSSKEVKSNQRSGPTPPKLAIFDGKSEWKPYFMQFNHIARKYEWSNEQKLDRLIECLRDKALKFVSTRQETVQKDYDMRQLQEVRQFVDESIEEFAERIQELATDGYLNTPENVVDTIAVDAFLKGCTDKKAALFAMEKDPNTMDQALQYVKSSIHNQKILLGYRKPEVKRVQFYDDSDEESTECLVRQVKTANNSSMQDLQKKYETMETRMATTEQHIWTIKSDIKKIINSISPKTTADRQRSPSPRGRSPTRDIRDIQCYTCREMGHYSTQCPKKSWSPMRRNRSPSPNNNLREGTLNEQGLKIELKPEVFRKKQVTISDSSAVHCNLTDFDSGQKEDKKNGIDNPQLREVQLYPSDRNPESNTLVLGISINEVTVNAVIDTAAQVTLMSEEFAKKLKPPVIFKGSLMLKGAGKDNSITARYTECVTVKVGKTDTKWKIIVAKINDQVILGLDFLKHLDAVIDLTDLSITIRGEKHFINEVKSENSSFKICRITLEETLIVPPNSTVRLPVKLADEFENEVAIQPSKSLNGLIMPNILIKADSRVPIVLNNLTDKTISLKKNRFIGTAMEICEVIDEKRCDYEDRASVKHRIDTGNSAPVRERMRRTPLGLEEEEEKHLKDLLNRGVIQPSSSEWSAAPRMIELILTGLTWKICLAYIDDVIVLGKDFEDHLVNLRTVLERFRENNLKLKPQKCKFFQKEVIFLGKLVNEKGIAVNPSSREVILNWPVPLTKKAVESFLGFTNYHREHIKRFATLAEPLYALTKKKVIFQWEKQHQIAFESLQQALVNSVTLAYPDPKEKFILDTDASHTTIGAELLQVIGGKEAGKLHTNADGLSRRPDDLDSCNCYYAGADIKLLPCGGCSYCTRAQKVWSSFEDDVDYVVPLSVRSVSEQEEDLDETNLDSLVNCNWISESEITNMGAEQREDQELNRLIVWLEDKIEPEEHELYLCSPSIKHLWNCKHQLVLKNGILCYKWLDPFHSRLLLVVSRSLRHKILENCHDTKLSGHFGQTNTIERLKQNYIWYGLREDARNYVKSCHTCNVNKKANVKPKGPLGQFHAGIPMEKLHMDILGPLHESSSANKYVLVNITAIDFTTMRMVNKKKMTGRSVVNLRGAPTLRRNISP